jgi:hypothetical protein
MIVSPATAATLLPAPTTLPPTSASSAKSISARVAALNSPLIPSISSTAITSVTITSDGLTAEATTFTQYNTTVGNVTYPAYYQQPQNFMKPNAAFAPRQIQLGLKMIF